MKDRIANIMTLPQDLTDNVNTMATNVSLISTSTDFDAVGLTSI